MKNWISVSVAGFLGLLLVTGVGLFATGWLSASQTIPRNFDLHDTPKTLPEVRFQDADGKSRTFADFKGKIVLLNIWATWCGPCRREMPTLDRLQGKLGGPGFEVLALSIDRGGPKVVRKFFSEINIRNLALYIDPSAKAGHALKVVGLPVTLLLDHQGREIGRLVGPAEWDTPEMITFFRDIIAKYKTDAQTSARRPFLKIAKGGFLQDDAFRPISASGAHKQ